MSKKRATQHIDEAIGKRIRELHKKHPQLGHDGIGRLLEDAKIYVDAAELKAFLKSKNMKVKQAPREMRFSADPITAFGGGLTKPGEGIDR